MNSVSLLLSSSFIGMVFGAVNDFECNGFYFGNWYAAGECYPDTSSSVESSFMYVCDTSDGTLMEYEYSTRDCSGNSSATDYSSISYYSDYVYCSSSYSDCDYFYIISYDDDSDCDESGSEYDVYDAEIVNVCVNTSYSSSGTYSASSRYVTCSQDSYNVKYWTDSDSCNGDHDYSSTYDPEWYNSWSSLYDFKFYCSTAGEESECNEDGAFSMNNKYMVGLIASLLGLIYNQM